MSGRVRTARAQWIACVVAMLAACGDGGTMTLDGSVADGGGRDSAPIDAPLRDAPAPTDAPPPDDGGPMPDAPGTDGGPMPDAPGRDSGTMDAGTPDGGAPDTGRPDAGTACGAFTLPSLSTVDVATGLTRPVVVTQAPGVTGTLWIVETRGLIRLVRGGSVLATPFLDIQTRIGTPPSDERGLLGLAFHPDYA